MLIYSIYDDKNKSEYHENNYPKLAIIEIGDLNKNKQYYGFTSLLNLKRREYI